MSSWKNQCNQWNLLIDKIQRDVMIGRYGRTVRASFIRRTFSRENIYCFYITAGRCFWRIEDSFMFLTQTPQTFAETMRIGIVLCRELRRDARYACATIRMASTNKVCALLRKSAWDILSINRVFSPEISVCYIEAIENIKEWRTHAPCVRTGWVGIPY